MDTPALWARPTAARPGRASGHDGPPRGKDTGMAGERFAETRTPDEIDELARRARDGDRDALELLLAAVRPRTLNICRGVLPYTPDAEDACQEAMLNAATKIASWGGRGR